jgi:dehydrogenase/reductase SDR family member 7B
MSFAGQAAWITGASSGIGEALARELARRGCRLVLSGRNQTALDALAGELAVNTLVLPFEATDLEALPSLSEQAWEWSGGIDMLVNNAGVAQRSLALDTELAVYRRMLDVDLLAPIALTQQLLPRMALRGSGRLVFISSLAGKIGVPLRTAYCAAKHGLIGYADALRAETAGLGLTVHVAVPGSVRTGVARNALTADGSPRGTSDPAIDSGIDPTEAARELVDGIEAGAREIVVARRGEAKLALARSTPDAVFDKMAGMMTSGYVERMKVTHG